MGWLEGGGAVASVSAAEGGDQKVWTRRRKVKEKEVRRALGLVVLPSVSAGKGGEH